MKPLALLQRKFKVFKNQGHGVQKINLFTAMFYSSEYQFSPAVIVSFVTSASEWKRCIAIVFKHSNTFFF